MPTQRTQYPRPINKQDSSAKFPNRLTYPNGTYASTGSIGGTGSFGANLPVNRSSIPNSHLTVSPFVTQPIPNVWSAYRQDPQAVLRNTTPIPNVQSPYATTQAQGSFVSGSGQVNLQGTTTGGRGAVPTTQDRINATLQNQFSVPQPSIRPQGIFTGDPKNNANDAAWVNYWNYQAANPQSAPPVVMTRDQIWNMKVDQRRRKKQEAEFDDQNRQYQEQAQGNQRTQQPTYQPFFTRTVGFRTGTG